MNLFSLLFRRKKREYKIGLALGSGGAKGFATLVKAAKKALDK